MNIVHSSGMNQVFLDLNPHVFEADLVAQLVEQARVTGLQMTGDGGLPLQLTKRIGISA